MSKRLLWQYRQKNYNSRVILYKILQKQECISICMLFKGEATWRFSIIALSHFKRAPNLHFPPKTPHFGPKMLFKHFSVDFGKFQIFEIFRFWRISGFEKYFFSLLTFFGRFHLQAAFLNIFQKFQNRPVARWHHA